MNDQLPFTRLKSLAVLKLGLSAPAAQALIIPQATSLRLYTPVQPTGWPDIGGAALSRATGVCFAHSAASPHRPDAYRSSADNAILNPCYAALNDQAPLACARDPWQADGTLLTLSRALQSNVASAPDPDDATGTPWALELANGVRCTMMTGATAPIAGVRIDYGCSDRGLVADEIDRRSAQWQVIFQAPGHSRSLTQVAVIAAWY